MVHHVEVHKNYTLYWYARHHPKLPFPFGCRFLGFVISLLSRIWPAPKFVIAPRSCYSIRLRVLPARKVEVAESNIPGKFKESGRRYRSGHFILSDEAGKTVERCALRLIRPLVSGEIDAVPPTLQTALKEAGSQ